MRVPDLMYVQKSRVDESYSHLPIELDIFLSNLIVWPQKDNIIKVYSIFVNTYCKKIVEFSDLVKKLNAG